MQLCYAKATKACDHVCGDTPRPISFLTASCTDERILSPLRAVFGILMRVSSLRSFKQTSQIRAAYAVRGELSSSGVLQSLRPGTRDLADRLLPTIFRVIAD